MTQKLDRPPCPRCASTHVRRAGTDDMGWRRWHCCSCEKKWSQTPITPKPKSGVIPVPVREREFRELRRDVFAHMELAMKGPR